MRLFIGTILACSMAIPLSGQQTTCNSLHLSERQFKKAMSTAKTDAQRLDLACLARKESARFEELADRESANLEWANMHHVGGPKFPSNADHSRTVAIFYKEKAQHYAEWARQLQTGAERAD